MQPIQPQTKSLFRDACIGAVVAVALTALAPGAPFGGGKGLAAMTMAPSAAKPPKTCE